MAATVTRKGGHGKPNRGATHPFKPRTPPWALKARARPVDLRQARDDPTAPEPRWSGGLGEKKGGIMEGALDGGQDAGGRRAESRSRGLGQRATSRICVAPISPPPPGVGATR